MRLFFYAQTRAEEISRKSGARVARRVEKKNFSTRLYTDVQRKMSAEADGRPARILLDF